MLKDNAIVRSHEATSNLFDIIADLRAEAMGLKTVVKSLEGKITSLSEMVTHANIIISEMGTAPAPPLTPT